MIEHGDVREALQLAAVEPDGLDRLEAGDTAEAAMLVGHLAACPDCLEEMARLRRADTLLRPILASEPDPALREMTLALVRAAGVQRGAVDEPPPRLAATRRRVPLTWAAALAAALVVGLFGGALIVQMAAPDDNNDPAIALDQVTRETAALVAAGDARAVALSGGPGAGGTLILSPSEGRMVVSATGLDAPPRGSEYRCWVEVDGSSLPLGVMWWAGDVAWWAGDVAIPADIPPGVVYGVSLVEEGAPGPGTAVLTGSL